MASPEETPLHLTLTFRHRNESSDEDAARAFWSQVQQNYRSSGLDEASPRRLEERVVSSFGRDLRDTLINEFMFGRGARNRYKRSLIDERLMGYGPAPSGTIPMFAFQVTGLNYGSLSLGLDIAGVKGLVEFFDSNYALFQTVLTQYAPLAFAVAATGFDTAYIDGLTCTVNAPQQIMGAFNQGGSSLAAPDPSQQGTSSVPQKTQAINWAWVVSNTSLILPVALALAVVYMAFQSLSNERAEVGKAMLQLQERQNEVIRLLVPQPKPPVPTPSTAAPATTSGK
jgi:hypothetical protein